MFRKALLHSFEIKKVMFFVTVNKQFTYCNSKNEYNEEKKFKCSLDYHL